jgi:hypothetical protein
MERHRCQRLRLTGFFTRLAVAVTLTAAVGCGTTRMTDTQRTATEQLLVSNAIDQAVSELNFQALTGKTVYFDPQYLDGTVDRGYLVSSMRQQLLATGCILQEDKTKADYVVETRSGSIGTDRHAVLLGIPQMNVPTFLPGQPSMIPEIPFAKKTDQEGVAKIAVFAYNRRTGQPVWQSGVVKATSTSKDTWVLGAGPFQRGTIRHGTEFAGEQISIFTSKDAGGDVSPALVPLTQSATWVETPAPKTDSKRLAVLLGAIPLSDRPKSDRAGSSVPSMVLPASAATVAESAVSKEKESESDKPQASAPKPPAPPAMANTGGQAESEPSNVMSSGLGSQPGTPGETEPSKVTDTGKGFDPEK